MDLDKHMNWLEEITRSSMKERMKGSPQFTLGKLIEKINSFGLSDEKGNCRKVYFDFGSAVPTTLASWRGSYMELALGYELTGYDGKGEAPTAQQIYDELTSAIGKEFTGWKGGEFLMDESIPIWVANPGNGSNTAVIGVMEMYGDLIIQTAYLDY